MVPEISYIILQEVFHNQISNNSYICRTIIVWLAQLIYCTPRHKLCFMQRSDVVPGRMSIRSLHPTDSAQVDAILFSRRDTRL